MLTSSRCDEQHASKHSFTCKERAASAEVKPPARSTCFRRAASNVDQSGLGRGERYQVGSVNKGLVAGIPNPCGTFNTCPMGPTAGTVPFEASQYAEALQ